MNAPTDKELDDLQTQIRHEADYADVELFMEGETPAGVWYRRIDDAITALRAEVAALRGLLRSLSEWDMMDSAADSPYWRKQIDAALKGGK